MATHSNILILAWRIPWTGEPGGLQSMGSQRVKNKWTTNRGLTTPAWYSPGRAQVGVILGTPG